jgi:hypothetical protein
VTSDAAFHRGHATDARMDSAKIVVGKIQSKRRFQVFPLLRKSIRQSRKSPHSHSDI